MYFAVCSFFNNLYLLQSKVSTVGTGVVYLHGAGTRATFKTCQKSDTLSECAIIIISIIIQQITTSIILYLNYSYSREYIYKVAVIFVARGSCNKVL